MIKGRILDTSLATNNYPYNWVILDAGINTIVLISCVCAGDILSEIIFIMRYENVV
jgi:hypothetical protein